MFAVNIGSVVSSNNPSKQTEENAPKSPVFYFHAIKVIRKLNASLS